MGSSFINAAEGSGGEGTRDLVVDPAGSVHTFVWASGENLGGQRISSVYLKVTPDGGTSDSTGAMRVHNLLYVGAVENPATSGSSGRMRLYSLDAVTGRVRFLQAAATGGLDPSTSCTTTGSISSPTRPPTTSPSSSSIPCRATCCPWRALPSRPGCRVRGTSLRMASGSSCPAPATTSACSPGTRRRARSRSSPARTSTAAGGWPSAPVPSTWPARRGTRWSSSRSRATARCSSPPHPRSRAGGSPLRRASSWSGRVSTSPAARRTTAASTCWVEAVSPPSRGPRSASPRAWGSSLASSGARLYGVGGTSALVALSIDPFGAVTEDAASPLLLPGLRRAWGLRGARSRARRGRFAVSRPGPSTRWAASCSGEASPYDTQVELLRIAVSD